MNKTSKTVLIIAALIIVIGGALILFRPSKSSAPSKSNSTTSNTNGNSDTSTKAAASIITYDGSSFKVSVDTIKAGDSVKVINNSNKSLDFDSDPHPVHTDEPELNVGDIEPGQSKTFTVTKSGEWGFHNHLDSSQNGKITVE